MSSEYIEIVSEDKKETAHLMTKEQEEACKKAIYDATVEGVVESVLPISTEDVNPNRSAQITMTIEIGRIFDISLSEKAAKSLFMDSGVTLTGYDTVKLSGIAHWHVPNDISNSIVEAIGWSLAIDFALKSKFINNTRRK